MKHFVFASAMLLASISPSTAGTISITSCSAANVSYDWTSTSADPTAIGSDGTNRQVVFLSGTSGSETTDFSAAWGGSDNSALSVDIVDGSTTASASCP